MASLTSKLLLGAGIATAVTGFLTKGAEKPGMTPIKVKFSGDDDYRAKLRVPDSYITGYTTGPLGQLAANGGIVFPYTPSISYETSAVYDRLNAMHSNFPINSYKNSNVSNISLTAKFTVQNDIDAGVYLSTIHLLKALTKMRFGTDADAGAPPPVCRLDAYGAYMLKNVPVSVASFKHDLPDGVDYYLLSNKQGYNESYFMFEQNFVPTVSTITLSLIPMYSRNEQLNYGVDDFLNGNLNKPGMGQGYL